MCRRETIGGIEKRGTSSDVVGFANISAEFLEACPLISASSARQGEDPLVLTLGITTAESTRENLTTK